MNHSQNKADQVTRLPSLWLSNLRDEERKKKEIELKHYLVSWPFLRLKEILLEEKRKVTRQSDYSSPSWAYQQAHNNGKLQQIEEIIMLLEGMKTKNE